LIVCKFLFFLSIFVVDDPLSFTFFTWLYEFLSTLRFSLFDGLPLLPVMLQFFIMFIECSLKAVFKLSFDFYLLLGLLFLTMLLWSFDLFLFIKILMFSLFYSFYFEILVLFDDTFLFYTFPWVISVDLLYEVFVKKLSINMSEVVAGYLRFTG